MKLLSSPTFYDGSEYLLLCFVCALFGVYGEFGTGLLLYSTLPPHPFYLSLVSFIHSLFSFLPRCNLSSVRITSVHRERAGRRAWAVAEQVSDITSAPLTSSRLSSRF